MNNKGIKLIALVLIISVALIGVILFARLLEAKSV